MNQMNMAGMNPAAGGGPVGGVPMANNGSSAPRSDSVSGTNDPIIQLNTYIYDYFLKRGYHDCARALAQDDNVPINASPQSKNGRRDGEVNGVDPENGLGDSKEEMKKIPDDLPRPNFGGEPQQSSFLLDWWNLFWDIFSAQRKKGRNSEDALQYVQNTQNLRRLRDQHQNQLVRQSMVPNNQFGMRQVRPGMLPPNLQKTAMQNNSQNMNAQQVQQMKNQQMLQHQMQREHSDMDVNGQRPQSPSSVENAPSPSKRPRLEGSQVNGQPQNGRGQAQNMPGQPNPQTNSLMMQHGLNPRQFSPQQLQALQAQNPAAQAKSLQVYTQNMAALQHQRSTMNNQGMPNGLMNHPVMPNQEMMQMPDGQGMLPIQDFNGANPQMGQMRAGMQNPNGQSGNHALQDYQMQLMLLEHQNKRRLMVARQEQDSSGQGPRPDGSQQPGMPGQNLPAGTSPQDSRTGASPNPSEQMKRGTPKIPQNGLPGSPNVGDAMAQGRGSPASMNFGGGQIPPGMPNAGGFFDMKGVEGVVGPNGMRPPSSNPAFSGPQSQQAMEAMARQQQGGPGAASRMPSGNWQQGPQAGQQQQQQQPPVPPQAQAGQNQAAGTPQERNAMPPPQAPAASGAQNNATGRTQTSSPQPGNAAPPTPQQANKPAPAKTKKQEAAERSKKRNTKKGANAATTAAAATSSSEAEPPPTPTPTTPITPVHANSFNKNTATSNAQQPTSAPQALAQPQPPQPAQQQQPPQQPQQPPQQDAFAGMNLPDQNGFTLDFTALDNQDTLMDFDFDSFLNTDDTSAFPFDPNIPAYPPDGVEASAGDNGM